MANKWDELGADWTNLPSGIELYSGFFHIMSAINERHRVARRDPFYTYYDLTELQGQLTSGSIAAGSIAVKIRDGIGQLQNYYIAPNATAYDTSDSNDDNFRAYDISGIPKTFSVSPTFNTGLSFEEYYGTSVNDIFLPYITGPANEFFPDKNLLIDAYNVLQEFYILRATATRCTEYTKTVLEKPGAGVNGAFLNAVYAGTPTVVNVKSIGSGLAPGFIYYHATLGSGGGSDAKSWFTASVDTWSSGINGSHRRSLPAASVACEYFYDLLDEDGNVIQPSIEFDGLQYWIGTGGPFQISNSVTYGDLGPTNSTGARSNYNQNAFVYPRAAHTFSPMGTVWDGTAYTNKLFPDPGQADGLPTVSYWDDGNASKVFACARLDRLRSTNTGSNGLTLEKLRHSVTTGTPSPSRTLQPSISVDLKTNSENWLKYNYT